MKLMHTYFLKATALSSVLFSVIHPGVYILCDLPKEVSAIVQENQEALMSKIEAFNKEKETAYIFQKAPFSPHLSLAFVNQDQLSVKDITEKYPALSKDLQEIAAKHTQVDITSNFKDAAVDYWPGKFEIEIGGSKKKNYVNIVLKASNNNMLTQLAASVGYVLKEKYNIEQRFPFSTHITLGRICDQNDASIDKSLETALKANNKKHESDKVAALMLTQFKLKGHDGSEEVFKLSEK